MELINNEINVSKQFKFVALYSALDFFEEEKINEFIKSYSNGQQIVIHADQNTFKVNNFLELNLIQEKDFVLLEFLDYWFQHGHLLQDLVITNDWILLNQEYKLYFDKWGKSVPNLKSEEFFYKSRLYNGLIERQIFFQQNNQFVQNEYLLDTWPLKFEQQESDNLEYNHDEFVYDNNKLLKYCGSKNSVIVPKGTKHLDTLCFYDNHNIQKVILPEGLISIGGDAFFNCVNLESINLPSSLTTLGNNPFAGCRKLKLINNSQNFQLVENLLYNKLLNRVICCQSLEEEVDLTLLKSTKVIGKHCFYNCNKIKKLVLNDNLKRIENNPFSAAVNMVLTNTNHDKNFIVGNFQILNNSVYSKDAKVLYSVLSNQINPVYYCPESLESISRNSFYGIEKVSKIIFNHNLKDIGYNPFVNMNENLEFVSHSPNFVVKDGMLYNSDLTKLICCPVHEAQGHITLLESVKELERGCFASCKNLTSIDLGNVTVIEKNSFINCQNLTEIYCSDLIKYISQWAFAYCSHLQQASISKKTNVHNSAFLHSPTKVLTRSTADNYLINSDNYYTLQSLLINFENKIDSIIIDPPYNSKIDYIGYEDNIQNYSQFMKTRIELAHKLLSETGFLVINIDDGEYQLLYNLCQLVFGNDLVSLHQWKKKHPWFDTNRVVLNPHKLQTDYEYIIICKKSKSSVLHQLKKPYLVNNELFEEWATVPNIFDCFGTTSSAKDEIAADFGDRTYFSTPKPIKLIKELIRATTTPNSTVMDFFAGSGTLGVATNALNQEDNGNRRFILVTNNEDNICEHVTHQRLIKHHIVFNYLKTIPNN
ncbi:leucine-rich repeat protein [Ureaplasma ceti]|uniref:DNA methylase N-4/N-6 domain-containing protein n=1 Tax=Ureaplasma ceti TaxID=3119530 RepID=A0ABP9U4M0_9BACT